MLGKISIAVPVTAMLMVLSAPADARFGGGGRCDGFRVGRLDGPPPLVGCPFLGRPFHRQVRVFFGRPFYGARFYGGVDYGACWRWQFTPWGWRLIRVCGYGYGYPLTW
jgi:hypothetical protein